MSIPLETVDKPTAIKHRRWNRAIGLMVMLGLSMIGAYLIVILLANRPSGHHVFELRNEQRVTGTLIMDVPIDFCPFDLHDGIPTVVRNVTAQVTISCPYFFRRDFSATPSVMVKVELPWRSSCTPAVPVG